MDETIERIPAEYLSFTSTEGNIAIAKEDESAYEKFCELRISHRTIVIVSGIFFISTSYVYAMSLVHPKSWIFLAILFVFSCVVRNPILMFMVYYRNQVKKGYAPQFIQTITPYFPIMMNYMAVFIALTLGLFLIARVLNGKCESVDQMHVWSCNSEYDSHALPQESVLSLMFLPLVFSIAFKTIRTPFVLMTWGVSVLCIIIAIVLGGAIQSLPVLIVYIPLSIIFLFEIHRQNVILFLIVKKQQTLLVDNKKLSEEAQNELRFMIANMAHDLKTVWFISICCLHPLFFL